MYLLFITACTSSVNQQRLAVEKFRLIGKQRGNNLTGLVYLRSVLLLVTFADCPSPPQTNFQFRCGCVKSSCLPSCFRCADWLLVEYLHCSSCSTHRSKGMAGVTVTGSRDSAGIDFSFSTQEYK